MLRRMPPRQLTNQRTKISRDQANQTTKKPTPDHQPSEVLFDHRLYNFLDQLRGKLIQSFFDNAGDFFTNFRILAGVVQFRGQYTYFNLAVGYWGNEMNQGTVYLLGISRQSHHS